MKSNLSTIQKEEEEEKVTIMAKGNSVASLHFWREEDKKSSIQLKKTLDQRYWYLITIQWQ